MVHLVFEILSSKCVILTLSFFVIFKFNFGDDTGEQNRFWVQNSTAHHLYNILCVHNPKSSPRPSPFSSLYPSPPPPPLPWQSPYCDLTIITLLSMSTTFLSSFFLFYSILPHSTHSPALTAVSLLSIFNINFKDFIYLFLERRGKGKREGEKHQCERETSIGSLSYGPQLGTQTETQVLALTGNHTSHLSLCRMMPNQPRHAGQGLNSSFKIKQYSRKKVLSRKQSLSFLHF